MDLETPGTEIEGIHTFQDLCIYVQQQTFFELLAFRSLAVATLFISGFLQLDSQFSGSRSIGLPTSSHKWLLLGAVALVAVQEFW